MILTEKKVAAALPEFSNNVQTKTAPETEPVSGNLAVKENENHAFTPIPATINDEYPSGLRLGLIVTSAFASMFLVSLVSLSPIESSAAHIITT